jgi:hypothetical protein
MQHFSPWEFQHFPGNLHGHLQKPLAQVVIFPVIPFRGSNLIATIAVSTCGPGSIIFNVINIFSVGRKNFRLKKKTKTTRMFATSAGIFHSRQMRLRTIQGNPG